MENQIELWTSTRVIGIHAGLRELYLEGNERLGYDRLLLTTGGRPRRLAVPGTDLAGIYYLRTLADSEAIARRIGAKGHLVVVGSGWIGAEIAASARQKGCEVTVLEMGSLPLERVLGAEVGQIYLDIHRQNGVEFLPETMVERFEGEGSVERVVTRDGGSIETDFVVVGVGVAPRSGLAEAAGIPVHNGILVNESLQTGIPGVFAAGDVANAEHPFYRRRIRVEHWANARKQGEAAARAMLDEKVSYDEIPYFFSDQYDVSMEYSGFATDWDEVVFRGDVAAREFIAFWLRDGRVQAGMNVNVWDVNESIRDLIRSRQQVDPVRLSDVDVPLTSRSTLALAGGGHE
jgi:3-phenylpropionate/trans-cinnamate dioxygenase ferredoxin reductase subunit